MAYVGQGIKGGTFSVLDTSGNTYNGSNVTFNLGTQVSSPAQLLVSHDGVIQKPVTDYVLATGGTQITFTTAPASGASIFITEISGAVGAPMNRDINGDELILDADADTSITADTDDQIDIRVAGTDQITIKDGAVSPVTDNDIDLGTSSLEYKDGYFDGTLHCDVLDLAGTEHTSISSGLSETETWRVSSGANVSAGSAFFTSNWEQDDTYGAVDVGTGMTESSGVFSFPSTGIYEINFTVGFINDNGGNQAKYLVSEIHLTTDNSSYNKAAEAANSNAPEASSIYSFATTSCLFDVTNTTNDKAKFAYNVQQNFAYIGNTNYNATFVTFKRLGDT